MRKIDPLSTTSLAADFSLILSYTFAIRSSVEIFYSYFTEKEDYDQIYYLTSILKLSKLLKFKSTIPTCITEKESVSDQEHFSGDISF